MDFVPDDRLFFAPALTWQPSADTSVTFLTNFQQDTSKFATLATAHGTLLPNPNGEIPTSRFLGTPDFDNLLLTSYQLGYLLQHKFTDDLIFRQNVRYHDVDRDFRFTYGFGDLLDNFTTWERESITSRQRVGIFALDNQLQYRWDMDRVKQTLLAGINYNDLTDDFRGGFHAVAPINIFNPVYGLPDPVATPFADDAQTLSQLGLYFQDQIKIDDRLVIMGGGRQDFVDSRFTRTDFYTPGQPRTTETQSPQAFTGRAGLLYLFDSGIAPYFSYSTSFSPVPGADRERRPFQPETAENYEVGIKYEPIDWKGLFTLALFDTLREGALIPDPDDPLFMVQLGQVRTQGAEVEGVVTLAEGLNLIANYTYLDPRNLHPRDPAQGPIPPAVPRNMGSIWAEYRVPSGDFAGLGVAAGMRHMGSTLDWTNDLTIPANTVMDAMLSYQVDRWRFSVNANNILDETFVAWCGGLDACAFGARRFILGSVRYSW
jgi:iron complex outermembrane receptor protein